MALVFSEALLDATLIIQARMESTRLPGKVLKTLKGIPLIEHLVQRLSSLPVRHRLVAVSEAPESYPLVQFLQSKKIPCVTGHPLNVYQRFVKAVKMYPSKCIIRVTADNPLTDEEAIYRGTVKLLEENLDYLWMEHCPRGCGCDIFKTETFLSYEKESLSPPEEEHMIPIFKNRKNLKGDSVVCLFPPEASQLSLTVDTEADYQKIQNLFELFYLKGAIDLKKLIQYELEKIRKN